MAERAGWTATKVASWVGLVLSLVGVAAFIWHVADAIRGSNVKLLPPEELVISHSDEVGFPRRGPGGPYAHFIVRFSYTNEAAPGYNAVIRREKIIFGFTKKTKYYHVWYEFISSDAGGPKGKILIAARQSAAKPFFVPARSAETHETLFQPWPKQCPSSTKRCDPRHNYLPWDEFLSLIKKHGQIIVSLIANVYGKNDPVTAKCTTSISKYFFKKLRDRRWIALDCMETMQAQ